MKGQTQQRLYVYSLCYKMFLNTTNIKQLKNDYKMKIFNKLAECKQCIIRIGNRSLCSIKGHKWGEGEAKQHCLRYGCTATRVLMWNRRNPFKPALRWHVHDISKLKLPCFVR